MDLEFITEGRSFTVYGMRVVESSADFLERLQRDNPAEYARIDRRIKQMAEHGASRHRDEFNDLGGGLFEMKATGGSRVIFFYDAGRLVICTHGFTKKTRKTPTRELTAARQRKAEYEEIRRERGRFRIIMRKNQTAPERRP